jgi:conjugal transfer mating pair stabilization protein TraN
MKTSCLFTIVLFFSFSFSAYSQGNPQDFEDGKNLGKSQNPAINTRINNGQASSTSPWNNTSAPQSSYYSSGSIMSGGAAVRANCASNPNDATCAGVNQSQVYQNKPVIADNDPVLSARSAISNPTSVLGSITGNYSGCVTQTRAVSPAIYDRQYCNNYFNRVDDQLCTKTISVDVQYSCPSGSSSGPTRATDPVTGAASWTCEQPQTNIQYICPSGWIGPQLAPLPPNGVFGSACRSPATNQFDPATQVTVTTTVVVPAIATETDQVDNQCAALEARVPPGFLPPDGQPSPPIATAPNPTDFLNKCSRSSSVCTQGPETRTINDRPVTRTCWQWTNSFNCLDADTRSDCNPGPVGKCTLASQSCVEYDPFNPKLCTHERKEFSCLVRDAVNEDVANCNNQTFCSDGKCWESGYPPDKDFASTVTYLEASREAGKYLDPNSLRVFKGYANRCVKKLGGLVDCCKRGGTNALTSMTNLSLALSAASTIGKAGFSSYTYDALFASDAPDFVIKGFESLFGTGFDSGLAGVLAGNLSVADFVTSLAPGPWTVAMLAIQYSGLLSCKDNEKATAMKRDANLCVDLGDYCSKCIRAFGRCLACIEKTRTFCCFNSRLAKIVNVQGRAQLGRGFGTAENPQCDGFTVAELQSLDFSKMDLREFYAEINPNLNNSGAGKNTPATVMNCYYNNGKCPK